MRKLGTILLSLTSILVFMGCSSKDQITVMVPTGSPQYSQIYLQDSEDYKVSSVLGADPLTAAFASKSHDVIFAPTNLGAKLYSESNDNYLLLTPVVFGNLFFVSQTKIESINDLINKDVYLYSKMQTPGIISEYVLNGFNIPCNKTFLADNNESASSVRIDSNGIYLVAEPQVSILRADSNKSIYTIDIQELYESLSGSTSYPQASVFVRKDLKDETKDKVLKDIKASIDKITSSYLDAAEKAISLNMATTTISSSVLAEAIKNSNLKYIDDSSDMKDSVVRYFNLLMSVNPKLIGSKLPDDNFYYNN